MFVELKQYKWGSYEERRIMIRTEDIDIFYVDTGIILMKNKCEISITPGSVEDLTKILKGDDRMERDRMNELPKNELIIKTDSGDFTINVVNLIVENSVFGKDGKDGNVEEAGNEGSDRGSEGRLEKRIDGLEVQIKYLSNILIETIGNLNHLSERTVKIRRENAELRKILRKGKE